MSDTTSETTEQMLARLEEETAADGRAGGGYVDLNGTDIWTDDDGEEHENDGMRLVCGFCSRPLFYDGRPEVNDYRHLTDTRRGCWQHAGTTDRLMAQMTVVVNKYERILRGNDAVAAVAHDDDGEVFWEIIQTFEEQYGSLNDPGDGSVSDPIYTMAAMWSLAIRRALAFEIEHIEKGIAVRSA